MNDPKEEVQANPPHRPAAGSELEQALEDLHLEPTLQELDSDQSDQVRGGQAGMMGMTGSMGGTVTKQTPLF